MHWKHQRGRFDLSHRGLVMGILNVTPDSFSDGGDFSNPETAIAHGLAMEKDGADIIDIGGESTRPGAAEVPEEEELRRVLPVIRGLRAQSHIPISIDTSKAKVADAAVQAGADIINDVTALQGDPAMREVARNCGAGIVFMHMQGNPRTMQKDPRYSDVVAEVAEFLQGCLTGAVEQGLEHERLAIDPGIGFGKLPEHNQVLLRSLPSLASLDRPILIGVSRKSFLAKNIADRFWPSVALTSQCRELGAHIFRVHDPKPHQDALRMTEAILGQTLKN